MFLSSLLFAAGLLVAETPDTLAAVTIVADKGVVVSRTDTVALRADGTAADALLRIPGLGISDYGGLAGLKGANLRGLGTAHTDIYLDGVRVSNFQSGQNDLGMLPLETLGNVVVDYAQNHGEAGLREQRRHRPGRPHGRLFRHLDAFRAL